MRCATESRRLIERGNVSRTVDIDKLDSCSEVTLGLCSTGLVTFAIWAIAVPFFDLGGIPWIKSWEGHDSGSKPLWPPITMAAFKQAMGGVYATPVDAFASMDADHNGRVNYTEFFDGVGTFRPPLNSSQSEYAFAELDIDDNHVVESTEFLDAFKFADFAEFTRPTTMAATIPTSTEAVTPATTTGAAPVASTSVEAEEPSTSAAASETSAAATTAAVVQQGPLQLTMLEFISRLGLTQSDRPRFAFSLLDTDGDKLLQRPEFLEAARRLPPLSPLSPAQAEDVFAHLDTSDDQVVDLRELFAAWSAGRFVEPATGATVQISLAEYLARMEHVSEIDAVEINIPDIDYDGLTPEQRVGIIAVIVQDLAFAAGVKTAAVKDLSDMAASVTLSRWEGTQAAGRRLSNAGLTVWARIDVPPGVIADVIGESVAASSTKQKLAAHLAQVPGVYASVRPESILVLVTKQNTHAFDNLDLDGDKHLNFQEFTRAVQRFKPPLTPAEADFSFKGLDGGHDGKLSAMEFEGYGLVKFFEVDDVQGAGASLGPAPAM